MCFQYLVLHQSFVVSESYESLSWSIEFQQTLPCKDLTKFMYDTQYGRHRTHLKCQNCNEWKWNWISIVDIICNVRCPKWAERCISALLKVIHPCMDLEVADLSSPAQVSSLHCVNICICSQASQPPQHHHIATMRRTPVSHHHSEHPRWWHHHLTLILNSIYSPITISPCRWCNSNNVNDFHHQQSLPPSSLEHVNKSSRSLSLLLSISKWWHVLCADIPRPCTDTRPTPGRAAGSRWRGRGGARWRTGRSAPCSTGTRCWPGLSGEATQVPCSPAALPLTTPWHSN